MACGWLVSAKVGFCKGVSFAEGWFLRKGHTSRQVAAWDAASLIQSRRSRRAWWEMLVCSPRLLQQPLQLTHRLECMCFQLQVRVLFPDPEQPSEVMQTKRALK